VSDSPLILPPFRSVVRPDGRVSIPIVGRPVELNALETFKVTITTPPLTCRRCKELLPDRKGHMVQPSLAEIDRLIREKLQLVLYLFCGPCADDVADSTKAGVTCYHGTPVAKACEGCNPPVNTTQDRDS